MKKKNIINYQFILLTIGCVLVLFASTFLFTRPAIWSSFNFNETGQIGDTIGGITAPIINVIGSILIYFSFKAQINANNLQFKIANRDILNQEYDRNFQVAIDLFKELKEDYKSFEHKDSKGQSALNVFSNELETNWNIETFISHTKKPIYVDWKFLICEYDLVLNHIINSRMRESERLKIYTIVYNYYVIQLEYSVNILKPELEKFNVDNFTVKLLDKFNEIHIRKLEGIES